MSKFKNIKISNADLPKTFICLNDRANYDWMRHWEANWYVAINRRYSIFWKHYDELYNLINVHWGLTFWESLANCKEHFPHIFKTYTELEWTSEDDDVFIYGFDTMHSWDNEVNWSKENVEKETKYLQKQMLSFYIVNDNDNETENTTRWDLQS